MQKNRQNPLLIRPHNKIIDSTHTNVAHNLFCAFVFAQIKYQIVTMWEILFI